MWHAKKAEYSELGESYKKFSASGLADVTNASYENAMSGNPVSQIFFLKNRDPNRWNYVKSINHLQLNVSDLRSTGITAMLTAGGKLYFVSRIAGRADVQTTLNHYVRPENFDLQDTMNVLSVPPENAYVGRM